jgi:hypothetical protein
VVSCNDSFLQVKDDLLRELSKTESEMKRASKTFQKHLRNLHNDSAETRKHLRHAQRSLYMLKDTDQQVFQTQAFKFRNGLLTCFGFCHNSQAPPEGSHLPKASSQVTPLFLTTFRMLNGNFESSFFLFQASTQKRVESLKATLVSFLSQK